MINYSIIIPHYNIPELLGRCLRSIPEREDVQVIVVDDNSPGNENYLSIVPELSRKNVEFYVAKEGKGAGHARNVGLGYAKGEWLVFSDSDDFFDDDFSSILDEYITDNHDIIYFNVKCCDCYDLSRLYEVDKLKIYKDTGDELALRVCYTEPWGKFVRRKIVDDNQIKFQETKAHNDLFFAVNVGIIAKRIKAVDKPIYWYVIREGSTGHQKGPEPYEKVCDRIRAWNSTYYFLKENGVKSSFFLPIIPCLKIIKSDFSFYWSLIFFMKNNGINYKLAIIDTARYFIAKLFNRKTMTFYGMINKATASYKKGE